MDHGVVHPELDGQVPLGQPGVLSHRSEHAAQFAVSRFVLRPCCHIGSTVDCRASAASLAARTVRNFDGSSDHGSTAERTTDPLSTVGSPPTLNLAGGRKGPRILSSASSNRRVDPVRSMRQANRQAAFSERGHGTNLPETNRCTTCCKRTCRACGSRVRYGLGNNRTQGVTIIGDTINGGFDQK